MIEHWMERASEIGFSQVAPLDVATLKPMQAIRDMCAADKCQAFGKNWTCPPMCGTLEQCEAEMQSYAHGILLQTVGTMAKVIDTRAMRSTEEKHLQMFHALADEIRAQEPEALCLGAGGCRICKKCAYPDPCRFPARACSSMEGYGLFVTQVCKDNHVEYYHGPKTITYTACILLDKR